MESSLDRQELNFLEEMRRLADPISVEMRRVRGEYWLRAVHKGDVIIGVQARTRSTLRIRFTVELNRVRSAKMISAS